MALRLSQKSHDSLMKLILRVQDRHKQTSEFRDKISTIDEEYAIQKTSETDPCDETVTIEGIKVPLVGAESDAITAQLAKLFVARQPIFPVLALKDNWDEAMAMQALIDRDARLLGWGRQLLLFLNRSVRYNVAAIAAEPVLVRSPVIKDNARASNAMPQIDYKSYTHTSLRALDMYNAIYDPRVSPADIQSKGEYAGYNELITRSALKILGTNLAERELAYNLDKAYKSDFTGVSDYYFFPPDISDYISARNTNAEINWIEWATLIADKPAIKDDMHMLTTLYIRLIPTEFGLGAYKGPKIYKLLCVNNQYIISVQEIVTPFDYLPVLFSDLREDGLGWQTKSPGEQLLPYQDSATELLNTRLQGSKRALSDRAIYDSNYLDPNQVNSIVPSAKIPLKKDLRNLGDNVRASDVYYQIPFEGQGVVNALTDLNTVMQIKDQVNGQNFASRGERQKGNRTAQEFGSIESRAEEKSLPYAIRLEEQVFMPLKQIAKVYVLIQQAQAGKEEQVIDPYTETSRTVDLSSMRSKFLEFKLTDGLFPKEAISNPDILISLIQNQGAFPEFNTEYDSSKMLADIYHLLNIDATKYRRSPDEINARAIQQSQPGPGDAATGRDTRNAQNPAGQQNPQPA